MEDDAPRVCDLVAGFEKRGSGCSAPSESSRKVRMAPSVDATAAVLRNVSDVSDVSDVTEISSATVGASPPAGTAFAKADVRDGNATDVAKIRAATDALDPDAEDDLGGPAALRKNLGGMFDRAVAPVAIVTNTTSEEASTVYFKVYLRVRPHISPTVELVNNGLSNRVRTFPPKESAAAKNAMNIDGHATGGGGTGRSSVQVKEYGFTKVLGPDVGQREVYAATAHGLVEGLFEKSTGNSRGPKKSALLFAYGITNAGKTHTIMGGDDDPGIMPRTLAHIFRKLEADGGATRTEMSLHLSYLEIHNEQIFDLLAATPPKGRRSALKLVDMNGHIRVRGLTTHKVERVDQGLELIAQAQTQMQKSSTNLNSGSSRSHSVCQLELSSPRDDKDDAPIIMWIVDLAGSERAKRTGVMAMSAQQREASKINTSLMNLMKCLKQIVSNQSQKGQGVVSYRESKLTYLFMNHLSGSTSGRTVMIVNVNPSPPDYDETQHVLSYATDARNVKISANEYRKRTASRMGATHGSDGRSLRSVSVSSSSEQSGGANNSRPAKVPRIRSKRESDDELSKGSRGSRAATLRPRPPRHEEQREQQEQREQREPGKVGRFLRSAAKRSPPRALSRGKRGMKTKNALANENYEKENAKLRQENETLKEQLSGIEEKIRLEVGEEMQEQIAQIHGQYDEANQEKNAMHMPTPARSARKIKSDFLETRLRELQDQVEECEEEMVRMKECHEQILREKEEELEEKNVILRRLEEENRSIGSASNNNLLEGGTVYEGTDTSSALYRNNSGEIDNFEEGGSVNTTNSDEEDSPGGVGREFDEEAFLPSDENKDASFGTNDNEKEKQLEEETQNNETVLVPQEHLPRRLPRGRCSEVACIPAKSPDRSPLKELKINESSKSTCKKKKIQFFKINNN
eukprot:CAMPEP_0194309010 /NCGR_PEP_ID=MMETSP0171-20130528/5976_1 /TAXON_ID=218684 /ORGANISM="Corethron pennatum, Strain L29A3" /LENGTH=915 /DNA_ID=CAMNT_0039061953 /DNA_START=264 /DNA_END=3011 /DNA_ORIENTATION=+